MGRNKLRILPPELVNLSCLKVLSIQKNRIEDLPLCLADMTSLQVLKFEGNPLRFPPKEVLQPQAASPPNGLFVKESEMNDVTVTAQIKRFLKQKQLQDRSETESGGESSEGPEAPRPLKRVVSGRFPIKVNGTDVPDMRSPALPRAGAPPIPSRSHYRGLSQQNSALRRPGVMPLTIGNPNERLRSNSESLLQITRDRTRRNGIVSKKQPDLAKVEETKANRYSHGRGLSHGSAMQPNGVNGNGIIVTRSPASPADSGLPRANYVRRLSSLPERKRASQSPDPVIEGAKGLLYALFQVHPLLQTLIGLTRDVSDKRNSLERVMYNAEFHIDELDKDLKHYITYSEEDEESPPQSNEKIHSSCSTCVSAYIHVCSLMLRNVDTLIRNGDPRYIRSLLLQIYGSIAEVRIAGSSLFAQGAGQVVAVRPTVGETIRPYLRDKEVTPTRDRPNPGNRSRSATVVHGSSKLRVATDPLPPFTNGNGRSATMTSSITATARSGDSFASSSTPAGGVDFTEEDRLFGKIFLRLQQSSELAIRTLPGVNNYFVEAMRTSIQQGNPDHLKQFWQSVSQKCAIAKQTAEQLKARLSLVKLKEPDIRSQNAFWELCTAFVNVRVLILPRHVTLTNDVTELH